MSLSLQLRKVVPRDEWLAARRTLLVKEKAFTQAREALARERRALPWEAVETTYQFEGPDGVETLPQLFAGRSQLIVYHFMFAPQDDVGCPHCSFWADNFNDVIVHLNQRDTSMVAISRAPYSKLAAYHRRMGWTFRWLSSGETSFNHDIGVSFAPEEIASGAPLFNYGTNAPSGADRAAISVFVTDGEQVFHTYSTYARGIDLMNTAYNYLDLTPKGRDEGGRGQFWVRRRDEYDR